MYINLPYGREQVPIDVPDNWINGRCYRPRPLTASPDARAELISAILNTDEKHELAALCAGKKNCAIAVDTHFPAVFADILPELVDQIEDNSDIAGKQITIVLSNRPWDPRSAEELLALVPEEIRQNCNVIAHDPNSEEGLEHFGKTPLGTELEINGAFAHAELKIVLGCVTPDLLLGFTGGRSVVAPGLMSRASAASIFSAVNIVDKFSRYGNFRDNPFHKMGLEALGIVGCHLAISVAMTLGGEVSQIFAGHCGASHLAAMNYILESIRVNVREPMDIVVTSGGGSPRDSTLASIITTLSAVQGVLKPDGTIVIAAGLEDGLGSKSFEKLLLDYDNVREAIEALSKDDSLGMDTWLALRLYSLLQEHEIILYNKGIDDDLLWRTGLTPSRDMNEAILGAMESHGQRCKIVALPDGPLGVGEIGPR